MPPPFAYAVGAHVVAICGRTARHARNVDRRIRPWQAPRSAAANDVARTALVTGRMDDANT
ncbi:hypothetical protein GGR70_002780 [Xanthomonas campestris]|nr:hypothetical protein [Xanthomonas campestris]